MEKGILQPCIFIWWVYSFCCSEFEEQTDETFWWLSLLRFHSLHSPGDEERRNHTVLAALALNREEEWSKSWFICVGFPCSQRFVRLSALFPFYWILYRQFPPKSALGGWFYSLLRLLSNSDYCYWSVPYWQLLLCNLSATVQMWMFPKTNELKTRSQAVMLLG